MNTTPQALKMPEQPIRLKNAKKFFWAILLDIFLWSYSILVTYKIVYQRLILDLRFPEFAWSQPIYSLAIGAAVALVLLLTSKLSIGKAITGLYNLDENETVMNQPFAYFGYLVLVLTFIAGFFVSQVSVYEFLSSRGLGGAKRLFLALLDPNWGIFEDALFAAIETIYMAFIATTVSLPLAFLFGFLAARNLMDSSPILFSVYSTVRFFLNLTRSIEPLVWAIIFSVWVGIGPFAGMLALCLHTVSSLAKLYSEQIENIDDGPIEAITATGAHPFQVIWYGVVPQIVLPYLSFTIYRWDINVRMATIIGLVGGGGIGTLLMQYQGLAKWNEVGMLVIMIAFIVWMMDYASSKIRAAIK